MLLMNLLRTPLTVGLSTLTGLVLAAGAPTLEPGPALGAARMAHSTLVQPDGTVLLIGGHGTGFASLATVEHLDPWGVSTGSPALSGPHDGAAVTRLPDGTVFIGGGAASLGIPSYDRLEVYDPATRAVLRTGRFQKFRASAGAAVLSSGAVLVAGAWWTHNDAHTYPELVSPATLESTLTGPLTTPRAWCHVIPLDDGGALVLGGVPPSGGNLTASPERYDPARRTFTPVAVPLFAEFPQLNLNASQAIKDVSEIRLADGRCVLLAFEQFSLQRPLLLTVAPDGTIARLAPPEAFPDSATDVTWNFAVDRARNVVHVLSARYPSGNAQVALSVTTIGADGTVLASGSTGPQALGYYLPYAGVSALPDGSIFLTGGHLSNNFDPVARSLRIEVPMGPSLAVQLVPAIWITGTPGTTCTVQYATELNTNWTALADVLLTNSVQPYVDLAPDAKQRFYRVETKP